MNRKIRILFLSFIFIFLPLGSVLAHQPKLVEDRLTDVENPEISQAFYAVLEGEPDYYQIESSIPFKLYVGLLVPDVKNVDKDYSAEIYKIEEHSHKLDEILSTLSEVEPLHTLNGLDFEWTYYYEEFGGDGYFSGPELRANDPGEELPEGIEVEGGVYIIKVFSPDNLGKYVLVVGEIEAFPVGEMLRTIVTLPKLKKDFFEKSPLTAYFNLTGIFMLLFLLLTAGFTALAVWILRKLSKKN